MLPEVRPSSGRFGVTAEGCGLPAGIPVSGIGGDQQAALFGQACFAPGMTKNTYGTGQLRADERRCRRAREPVEGLLTSVAWELADGTVAYALEGAIFVTGAAIQWLRDGLGHHQRGGRDRAAGRDRSTTPRACTSCPRSPGSAARGGTRTPRARSSGITRGTGRAHLARAVVEAMAYQTRDVVEAMSAASGTQVTALRADGGASVMDLLLQLQADQLQVPVARPTVQETTALGAAYLAGLAEGVWGSLDDLAVAVGPRPRVHAAGHAGGRRRQARRMVSGRSSARAGGRRATRTDRGVRGSR